MFANKWLSRITILRMMQSDSLFVSHKNILRRSTHCIAVATKVLVADAKSGIMEHDSSSQNF